MTQSIRVAVVGVGYLGKIHAKIYAAMANVHLVGIADINEATAKTVAANLNTRWFTDSTQLLDQVDAVSIVVPSSVHQQVAEPFLQRGVHMLLEKPIAPTLKAAQAIVDLARAHNTILQIGHLERFNAGVMKLAELARDPRFIEVHRLSPFVERATDVDVVTDLMIHDIDIVLSLIRSELCHISATGTPVVTDHIDIVNARLEFTNGAVANVTASRVSRNPFRRIRVFSGNSYLGLNFADQQLEQIMPGQAVAEQKFPPLVHRAIPVTPQQPLDAEIAHFIECVKTGRDPLVGGEDGLVAVRVSERVKQTIKETLNKSS